VTTAQPGTTVGHYVLDKSASRFTVRAYATGMLSALGHNPTIRIRDFTGEASFDPDDLGKASLRIAIRADSLEVTDEISSNDRREIESMMNEKVLDSSTYPAIVFESAATSANPSGEGRFRATMNGKLSLRGVTRNLPVTAQVIVTGSILRASGEFSIRQSDYDIPPISVAGGTLKLKDELKFSFDVVARRQE
jgi:polyisoprenoid-binding protein YceI